MHGVIKTRQWIILSGLGALVVLAILGLVLTRNSGFPSGADATSQGSTLVRKRLELGTSLYQMLQIVSLTLFEKTPILCALQTIDPDANFAENLNQLILFDF